MKLFSACSGPCETCKCHYSLCLAGHGDDDYEYADPEWIKACLQEKENKSTDPDN